MINVINMYGRPASNQTINTNSEWKPYTISESIVLFYQSHMGLQRNAADSYICERNCLSRHKWYYKIPSMVSLLPFVTLQNISMVLIWQPLTLQWRLMAPWWTCGPMWPLDGNFILHLSPTKHHCILPRGYNVPWEIFDLPGYPQTDNVRLLHKNHDDLFSIAA